MPTMTRTWVIPASREAPQVTLDLQEPSLTGDGLGHKTWGTSYVIAKKLSEIGRGYIGQLLGEQEGSDTASTIHKDEVSVLECMYLVARLSVPQHCSVAQDGFLIRLTLIQ